jgi:hypothetical protein
MLIGDWGRVVSTYLYPYKEDVVRFDFEVDEEDEAMVGRNLANACGQDVALSHAVKEGLEYWTEFGSSSCEQSKILLNFLKVFNSMC